MKTTNKTPRTVEIKLLVPYSIIIIGAALLAGVVTGWHLNDNLQQRIANEAQSRMAATSPKE